MNKLAFNNMDQMSDDEYKCKLDDVNEFFYPDTVLCLIYYVCLTVLLQKHAAYILLEMKLKLHLYGILLVMKPIVIVWIYQKNVNEHLRSNQYVILNSISVLLELVFYYLLFKLKVIQVLLTTP